MNLLDPFDEVNITFNKQRKNDQKRTKPQRNFPILKKQKRNRYGL